MSGKIKSVRYTGPANVASPEIAIATNGSAVLEPGAVYELEAELADSLVSSSAWFEQAKRTSSSSAKAKPATPATEEGTDA